MLCAIRYQTTTSRGTTFSVSSAITSTVPTTPGSTFSVATIIRRRDRSREEEEEGGEEEEEEEEEEEAGSGGGAALEMFFSCMILPQPEPTRWKARKRPSSKDISKARYLVTMMTAATTATTNRQRSHFRGSQADRTKLASLEGEISIRVNRVDHHTA
eukprot:COSAG01_NODE_7978_length_2966_cov_7.303453_6_plen_158_part_00